MNLATLASTSPAADPAPTAHDRIGFQLGWDYAHHGLALPAPYAGETSPLRAGLTAGRAAFGERTLEATLYVGRWLQLRLRAWLRGRSVESFQVTPNYLRQIDATHCPITRAPLTGGDGADAVSIDRVRDDAGYAAGNLALMSTKANHAKGAHGFCGALQCVRRIEAEQLPGLAGLTASQWARVAVLCSFVEPLSHDEASALPLLVLPPNRVRLFNPVQALQAFVSQQLLTPGWSQRVSRFEDLLPGKSLKRDFKSFFMALLPRVLEGGRLYDVHTARWAIEDAWRASLVQQRWAQFARQLDAGQCEALLVKAAARRLTTRTVVPSSDAGAIDGWNLATRGYVPHAHARGEAQRELAW